MFRLFRSRLVWLTIGLLTLAGTAFWIVVVVAAAIMMTTSGGADPDPDELAQVAVPLGMLAATGGAAVGIMAAVVVRRGRARRWLPLREQMVRDAATQPATHIAQVVSLANSAAGGQVVARDLITGYQGPLWLAGWNTPPGAVVCFTATPNGPQVLAWMTGQLWRATSRVAARIERRTTKAYAAAEREQHDAVERQIRDAAAEAIAEAERILRQHSKR
jgi:hypothetical protein